MPVDWSKYPKDWKAIRARIQERAGDRCEWCGLRNSVIVIRYPDGATRYPNHTEYDPSDDPLGRGRVVKIVCTTAHVNHDTTDNRDENLAFLCQRCHLRHDAPLHAKNAAETRRRKNDKRRGLFATEAAI